MVRATSSDLTFFLSSVFLLVQVLLCFLRKWACPCKKGHRLKVGESFSVSWIRFWSLTCFFLVWGGGCGLWLLSVLAVCFFFFVVVAIWWFILAGCWFTIFVAIVVIAFCFRFFRAIIWLFISKLRSWPPLAFSNLTTMAKLSALGCSLFAIEPGCWWTFLSPCVLIKCPYLSKKCG